MTPPPPGRGRFITLEGPEGSGKTTAARHLTDWLRTRGMETVLTAEPGGTPLGEEIRRIVLHMRGMSDDLDPRADALLFAAGRAQHVSSVIRPALERGAWVVCARYLDSSLAYQGAGYGNDPDEMRRLQAFATAGLVQASGRAVELGPQNAYVRRLQHQMAERNALMSRSRGSEPNRRVELIPENERRWR